jgi:DNA-binding PadR family transcriptional regulator
MLNEREQDLSIALLELLSDTPLGERQAARHMAIKTAPKATPSEVQDRLKWAEGEGFASSIRDKNLGLFYSITTSGKFWLQQNG